MECKYRCNRRNGSLFFELIDTLWNVNFFQIVLQNQFLELIDTLWNVNLIGFLVCRLPARINRYIMECK